MTEKKRHRVYISFQHGCEDTVLEKSNLFTFSALIMHYQTVFYNLLTSLVRRTKSYEYERPYQFKY